MDRKCPLCREKIPPSKEMVAQLKFWRNYESRLEVEGDIFSPQMKSRVDKLEREVGVWTEAIDYSADDDIKCNELPAIIRKAAGRNDIQKVLDWLGPLPVDKQRLNAKNQDHMSSMVFYAMSGESSALLSILLQLGADVDPLDVDS